MITLVASVGLTVGALVGPGLANASSYPPSPPVPEAPVPPAPVPQAPAPPAPVPQAPAPPAASPPLVAQGAGALPSTGNSDVEQTLMIAAGTLLAGLAITGVAVIGRRRNGTGDAASMKPA